MEFHLLVRLSNSVGFRQITKKVGRCFLVRHGSFTSQYFHNQNLAIGTLPTFLVILLSMERDKVSENRHTKRRLTHSRRTIRYDTRAHIQGLAECRTHLANHWGRSIQWRLQRKVAVDSFFRSELAWFACCVNNAARRPAHTTLTNNCETTGPQRFG